MEERVFIAGAGPVGMVVAANLVRQGVPVTVFEECDALSTESRASTFHPSTLDMLDDLGVVAPLVAEGLKAPHFQYRTRDGILATFDFAAIKDVTQHPYRLQCEQFKLTRIILDKIKSEPDFEIVFGQKVAGVEQSGEGITVTFDDGQGKSTRRSGRWLVGADGASSVVRRSLGIEFEGFTWPERFLVVSTPFDFYKHIPGLVSVSYVADPQQWYFLLQIPGMWRVMFPIAPDMADEAALSTDYAQSCLRRIVPDAGAFEVMHTTLYRVHQRVAKSYRHGRAFLAGDAAHINNPLGGMGMNGGIHDAVSLSDRLAKVLKKTAPESELDRYDLQRRQVTVEYVQTQTIQNKKNLEAKTEEERTRFREQMERVSADPVATRDYLLRVAMFASLRRAAELG